MAILGEEYILEMSILFSLKTLIFLCTFHTVDGQDIQNSNFDSCFVCVWNVGPFFWGKNIYCKC